MPPEHFARWFASGQRRTAAEIVREAVLGLTYNDYNESLAGRMRHQIGALIEELKAQASQSEPPPWLNDLIRSWHNQQATVITLNYDTLIERACKQVRL